MKYLLTIFLCMFLRPCLAQTFELSGKIMESENVPIAIANVMIYRDSVYVNGTITQQDGTYSFKVPEGNYTLKVSLIGYQTIFQNVSIKKDEQVPNLILMENTVALNNVVVVGKKPFVKRDIDRVNYDISNLPSAIGGNASELLAELPGVSVSRDAVNLVGKGSVKVYINGRDCKLSGGDLISYLSSYPTGSIKKVEVITTPPAKYEAEGNYGIINIVLTESKKDYLGGSVSSSYGYSEKENYASGSMNLRYNKNRVTAFLTASTSLGHIGYVERMNTYTATKTQLNPNNVRYDLDAFNVEGGIGIALNHNWRIDVQGLISRATPSINNLSHTSISQPESVLVDSTIVTSNLNKRSTDQKNLNFHIEKAFDESGKKMTFDVDYLSFNKKYEQNYSAVGTDANEVVLPTLANNYTSNEKRNSHSFASKLDFNLPFDAFNFNIGAKISDLKTDNRLIYETTNFPDTQNDHFVYKEQILALYADYSRPITSCMDVKLGVRMEYTHTVGESVLTDKEETNDYCRFFPSLYYQYKINKDNNLTLSFSSRIARPSNQAINPFKIYINKFYYQQGKTDLQPSYTYNCELNYTYKNNLNFSCYYSQKEHGFSTLNIIDKKTNILSIVWDNYIKAKTWGATGSYTLNACDWLDCFFDQQLFYKQTESTSGKAAISVHGLSYNASLRTSIYFNRQKSLVGTITGSYTSRDHQDLWLIEPRYNVSTSLRYNLLQNRLHLRLNVENIFKSNLRGTMETNGNTVKINNTFSYLYCSLGVSYDFGIKVSSNKRKSINADIKSRL